jgi:hypothetical protein
VPRDGTSEETAMMVPLPSRRWIAELHERVRAFLKRAHETPMDDADLTDGERAFLDFLVDSAVARLATRPAS